MTMFEFAETVNGMPVEKRNEFIERLKGELSEDEWNATVKFISLYGMFKSPVKYEAMKNAVCDTLCEELYGHTVERKNKVEDPCNPVYMTTIL